MKRTSLRRLLIRMGLLFVALGVVLVGCDSLESDGNDWTDDQDVLATRTVDETVHLDGQDALYLQNVNGDVEIERSDEAASIRIEAEIIAGSHSRRDAEAWLERLKVRIQKHIGTLVVQTDFPNNFEGRRLEVRYRVRIPSGIGVEVEHVNGKIVIKDVVGHVKVDHVNGHVEINNLHGTVDVHLINGTIGCQVYLDEQGFAFLNTVNGQISLEIPKNTSARLHGETSNGQVNFRDLPLVDETGNSRDKAGTLGSGTGRIQLKVVNGSIEVKGM